MFYFSDRTRTGQCRIYTHVLFMLNYFLYICFLILLLLFLFALQNTRNLLKRCLHNQFVQQLGILFGPKIVPLSSKIFGPIFLLHKGTIFGPNIIPNHKRNWMCRRLFKFPFPLVQIVQPYVGKHC